MRNPPATPGARGGAVMVVILALNAVGVARGGKQILAGVTLGLVSGAKIGVVGPNGAGKSTLLKIMACLEQPTDGALVRSPETTIGILLQDPPLDEGKTVLGNVQEGVADTLAVLALFHQLTERLAQEYTDDLLVEVGALQQRLDYLDAWDLDSRLDQAMHALRCPPPEAMVGTLSGGERRRVALCKLLLQAPDVLLLDEPTNHLDAESVPWLEHHLLDYPGTVVAVTHDRCFLNNVTGWILEIDRGHAHPYEGNYSTYLETKQSRLVVEGKKDAKLRRRLQQELDWIRNGAKGRAATSRSRLERYEEMAAAAEKTPTMDFEEIHIPPGPRLGTHVLDATSLTKGFGGRTLFRDLSFSLPRSGIVGVMGPNGAGKTTLFQMITGAQQPDSGAVRVGDTVRIAYVDQSRAGINPEQSAWEVVSGGKNFIRVGQVDVPSRAYLAAFGFKGADQQKPARLFSGGEQNRLNLALTLKEGGNLLLLDEPTNDLDTETLTSLESALLDFPGCVVVTTHDRWFLDRVATHILSWEGTAEAPGRWFWFEGNFSDYERNKHSRLGDAAAGITPGPHRKLTRG